MIGFLFLGLTLLATFTTLIIKKDLGLKSIAHTLLIYLLFFNLGVSSLLSAYAHIFMGPETAAMIGWPPGSPFQFEMGMANLAFGVLGIASLWACDCFRAAVVIGWNVLFIGCFVGHVMDYMKTGNTAAYNIGPTIWLADLILPLLALGLLIYTKNRCQCKS